MGMPQSGILSETLRLHSALALWASPGEQAQARSFLYRFLTRAYELPTAAGWQWLSNPSVHDGFCTAARRLPSGEAFSLGQCAAELVKNLHPGQFELFANHYMCAFGFSPLPTNPPRPAKAGFTSVARKSARLASGHPHSLGQLRAFVQSCGLELSQSVHEGCDETSLEFEFMSMLASKEAQALERGRQAEAVSCRDAQEKFVREYLACWPAFCQRLSGYFREGAFASLARFTASFIRAESHTAPTRRTASASSPAC